MDKYSKLKFTANKQMDSFIKELEHNYLSQDVELSEGLSLLLDNNLIEKKGLYLLDTGSSMGIISDSMDNREMIEFEESENYIRIDDYVSKKDNFDDSHFLSLGLQLAKMMALELNSTFPKVNFKLVLLFGNLIDGDIREFGNCSLTFFKERDADLIVECGENEAVLEIEVLNN